MALPQLDRLKSQLLTSGLQQRDNATWQVINQLIDYLRQSNLSLQDSIDNIEPGEAGITQLTGDVTAGPGSGSQVATIAPLAVTEPKIADDAVSTRTIIDSNVTYDKIQDVTPNRLLGRDNTSTGPPEELIPGDGLIIQDGEVSVSADGVTPGLGHKVLSPTHEDSIPADAVLGDLIYAGPGTAFVGSYAHALLQSQAVEDFQGIRAGYMLGFNNQPLDSGISGWGAPPPLAYITPELPDTWLAWEIIDGFLQTAVIEDFEGIRAGYTGGQPGNVPYNATGNSGGISGLALETIPAPDLANPDSTPLWQRLPIGTVGQIIQPNSDGVPEYTDDLELNGDADIAGDLEAQNVEALGNVVAGSNVTGNQGTFLASVTSPAAIISGSAIGVWTDVPFNAGDFTANGGTTPTWTLTAPDAVCFRYRRTTQTLIVQVYLAQTTVASAAGNVVELRILIPNGHIATGPATAQLVGAQENGAAVFDVYAGVDPATDNTKIFIRTFPIGGGRAFDQTPNASYFGFTLEFSVN